MRYEMSHVCAAPGRFERGFDSVSLFYTANSPCTGHRRRSRAGTQEEVQSLSLAVNPLPGHFYRYV